MHFERLVAAFLRRVRVSPSEFEQRGRRPELLGPHPPGPFAEAGDRGPVLAFMEACGRSRESDRRRDSSISDEGRRG